MSHYFPISSLLLRLRWLALLVVVFVELAACASVPVPAMHGLDEPFLSAWQRAGGTALGPPLGPPRSIDGRLVQFFARARIVADSATTAQVFRQDDGWQAQIPAPLLALEPAPQQATIVAQRAFAAPLALLRLALAIPSYSGPVELLLYDVALRPAGALSFEMREGAAEAAVLPRGQLGPQWVLVLVAGKLAGARNAAFTLEAETTVQSGIAQLDRLPLRVRDFLAQCVVSYPLDGATVRGYRSPDNPLLWLRDHIYQGRGFRYFERDVVSLLAAFRAAQRADGSFPDVLAYPSRGVKAYRKEVEADVEFLFVQGVYEAWQMTGDDAWLRANLEPMRRALHYTMSDPLRWNAERGLVRRPYTIDTWDFAYGPTTHSPDDGKPAPRHWIDEATIWGTFHGDNTGLAYALELLARAEERVGDPARAHEWRTTAKAIVERLNELSWNGSFYRHFVPEAREFQPTSVDPETQLSLSNALALNRNVLDDSQGRAIVASYFSRRDFARAFAEWYSIDPPFPAGSYGLGGRTGERPGEYVNGGIMPLVGGELARGAFRYSSEAYGFDILRRYAALVELSGASYLWYYPDGRPGISGPDTLASDGWGASAMLGALIEGAAGVQDRGSRYDDLILSPRWAAAPEVASAYVVARYAASTGYVAYRWERTANGLRLDLTGSAKGVLVRLLLPSDDQSTQLRATVDGAEVPSRVIKTGDSRYLTLELPRGDALIEIVMSDE